MPDVGHLGETLPSVESMCPMTLHLDGERALEHVDEERHGMHVASNLTTRRHLCEHSNQLVLPLGEADRLTGEGRRRLKNGRQLQPDRSMLLRLRSIHSPSDARNHERPNHLRLFQEGWEPRSFKDRHEDADHIARVREMERRNRQATQEFLPRWNEAEKEAREDRKKRTGTD